MNLLTLRRWLAHDRLHETSGRTKVSRHRRGSCWSCLEALRGDEDQLHPTPRSIFTYDPFPRSLGRPSCTRTEERRPCYYSGPASCFQGAGARSARSLRTSHFGCSASRSLDGRLGKWAAAEGHKEEYRYCKSIVRVQLLNYRSLSVCQDKKASKVNSLVYF